MALIDRIYDISFSASLPLEMKDLMEDAQHLVGVDRAQRQIVIRVAAVVKMEAAQHIFGQEPGNDLFDILGSIMMPGIDQHPGLWSGSARQMERHLPRRVTDVLQAFMLSWLLARDAVGLPNSLLLWEG